MAEPLVHRRAVRFAVMDRDERLLLFHTREPTRPEFGSWWELPGGGIDGDETYAETAVRELREETGILVPPALVGPATWRRRCSYRYRGTRRLQDEVIVAIRLDAPCPGIDESGRMDDEKEDYFGFRWWPVPEVVASAERFYPGRLPGLLPAFLAGEAIDEPFELWS